MCCMPWRCVIITPLGSDVVLMSATQESCAYPEVKRISASSSGLTAHPFADLTSSRILASTGSLEKSRDYVSAA